MRIYFTRSGKIGSRLIRWGLDEPVSHTVFVFGKYHALHSSIHGVEQDFWPMLKDEYEVVSGVEIEMTLEKEDDLWEEMMARVRRRGYDWAGTAYFTWSVLKCKFLNKPLPDKNAWNSEKRFLCTELAEVLAVFGYIPVMDYSLVSPERLRLLLLRSPRVKPIEI